MARLVLQRLALLIPTLLGLSVLLFSWVRALPGGPATALLGERATPEAVARINRLYGFDKPVAEQYLTWLGQLVRGQLRRLHPHQHPGAGGVPQPLPGDDRADGRRADPRDRRSASRSGYVAARHQGRLARPLDGRRVAARRDDPGVLPRVPAQVRVRGAARLVPVRRTHRPDDHRHAPHRLLRPGRAAHPASGTPPGTRSCTCCCRRSRSGPSRWRSSRASPAPR